MRAWMSWQLLHKIAMTVSFLYFSNENELNASVWVSIYALNEFIEYYKKRSTYLLRCLMQIKHLIEKSSDCYLTNLILEVPHCLLLVYLLFGTHTKICASVGVMGISPSFSASNGVKQGGISSPIFFKVYMDDLSVSL